MVDILSSELRTIEREIDGWYKNIPLFSRSFAECAWYILAFHEDLIFLSILKNQPENLHTSFSLTDAVIITVQYPIRWAWEYCTKGGIVPLQHDVSLYGMANDVSQLARNYTAYDAAYTYASRGYIILQKDGTTLSPVDSFYNDSRYEAYDHLVKPQMILPNFSFDNFPAEVAKYVTVKDHSFTYKFNKRLISSALKVCSPLITYRFSLPEDWNFGEFTLKDFRKVIGVLIAMANIHFFARFYAASQGCYGLGVTNSILLLERDKLEWMLMRYANVHSSVVRKLIEILTFGTSNVRNPDPALQPLIPLNETTIAIMPSLLMFGSSERNFAVLLNKIPELQSAYSKLVDSKENNIREMVINKLKINFRPFHGYITPNQEYPDVDLALISDIEKIVLILELKWFIEPSEPREIIEKSEEIRKGVSQLLRLSNLYKIDPNSYYSRLQIDGSYKLYYAVASESFIGHEHVQNKDIPVIKTNHLIQNANRLGNFKELTSWLEQHQYLPTENIEYSTIQEKFDIGPWSLLWPGIDIKIDNEYR